MSGRGHGCRCRQSRHPSKVEKLRQQVTTLKQELREANTGASSKRSACIRLLPHQPFAKIFRTVQIQIIIGHFHSKAPLSRSCATAEKEACHRGGVL